jgi:hypothetical protein
VGLCTHIFTGEEEINGETTEESWAVIDMWFTNSPFNQGEAFASSLKTSSDLERGGTEDWNFSDIESQGVESIPSSEKIALQCPL